MSILERIKNKLYKDLSIDDSLVFSQLNPNFIPYACHYDKNSIITKNGELIQIIKLVGFSHEMLGNNFVEIREIVRNAIKDNIKSDKLSLCFHTIRTKKNIDPVGIYKNQFSREAHAAWNRKNYWDDKYINELYITVMHVGQSLDIKDYSSIVKSLSYSSVKNTHNKFLAEASVTLDKVTSGIESKLAMYGAHKLQINKNKDGVFSDILSFIYKIINLHEKSISVPIIDLSDVLGKSKVAFGDNVFEIMNGEQKYFGGILSIKEYQDISSSSLDKLLQLPENMIISETVDFVDKEKAISKYQYQDYILKLSNDYEFSKKIGLDKIMRDNDEIGDTDFGFHQITVMVYNSNNNLLDNSIKRVTGALESLGVVVIREDIALEDCFWAQLPGNFKMIRRQSPVNLESVAGFASLHNFPAGKFNNPWGKAVALFRTSLGTPYFFNFHGLFNSAAVIFGAKGVGKTSFANFTVSEAMKYNPKVFYITNNSDSEVFINAIGGKYHKIASDSQINLNPFHLKQNEENVRFLTWLIFLITEASSDDEINIINDAIIEIYKKDLSDRNFNNFANLLTQTLPKFADILKEFNIALGGLLDKELNINKNDKLDDNICCFDIGDIYHKSSSKILLTILSYIMLLIRNSLNGEPAIIMIDDLSIIDKSRMDYAIIAEFAEYISQNNGAMIVICDKQINKNKADIIKKFDTKIYFADDKISSEQGSLMGLSAQEIEYLHKSLPINRNFILKQNKENIVAEINLTGLKNILSVLSASQEQLEIYYKIKNEYNNWLNEYYKLTS
jgi:type IV secretion system protein VirB4